MDSGEMVFVQQNDKNDFERKKIVASPQDIDMVGNQLVQSYVKILNHEFENICENEKCYWCNFAKNDYVFAPGRMELIKEYEE